MSFQDYIDEIDQKEKLPNYKNIALIGAVVIVLIGLIVAFIGFNNSADASSFEVVESGGEEQNAASDAVSDSENTKSQVCVYVTGCVTNPGVVYLDEGARIADAIEACGGMTDQASKSSLNLAQVIQDGEQISVPSIEEVEASRYAAPNDANSTESTQSSGSLSASSDKVNINTADVAQLQTLNGIGESKAKKIVDYREKNGLFKSIDDLSNVSGIGEKTVENLKDSICI